MLCVCLVSARLKSPRERESREAASSCGSEGSGASQSSTSGHGIGHSSTRHVQYCFSVMYSAPSCSSSMYLHHQSRASCRVLPTHRTALLQAVLTHSHSMTGNSSQKNGPPARRTCGHFLSSIVQSKTHRFSTFSFHFHLHRVRSL